MHIMGTAGTGKSVTIKAIMQTAEDICPGCTQRFPAECQVAIGAPTGNAAFAVGGITIHKLANLPTKGKFKPKTGAQKRELEQRLRYVRVHVWPLLLKPLNIGLPT